MKKNIFICSLIGALALSACTKSKEEKKTEPLSCENPQLITEIEQTLKSEINTKARLFSKNDARQFVDADKVVAAANELNVSLSSAQLSQDDQKKYLCNSKLNVTIPQAVLQQAQTNAPLLFGKTDFDTHLKQQLQASGFSINNNLISKSFQYTPLGSSITAASSASASSTLGSQYDQSSIQKLGAILSNALLSSGIKDTVKIKGHLYDRAAALALVTNPHFTITPLDQLSHDAQTASAILNGKSVSEASQNLSSKDNGAKPAKDNNSSKEITSQALQEARANNQNANNVINHQWVNLEETVRTTLRPEQHKWIAQKISQCQAKAANAANPTQAEYIRLLCDTQMTNERIKYLTGYSLH